MQTGGDAPAPADGETFDPDDFTFRDDFEDGDLDGWLGGGFGLAEAGALEPALPGLKASSVEVAPVAPSDADQPASMAVPAPFARRRDAVPRRTDLRPARRRGDDRYRRDLRCGRLERRLVQREHVGPKQRSGAGRGHAPHEARRDRHAGSGKLTRFPGFSASCTSAGRRVRAATLTNFGSAALQVQEITIDHADFTANVTTFDLGPGGSRGVIVTFDPAALGEVAAAMTVRSTSPGDDLVILLNGEGRIAPSLSVSQSGLSTALFNGETETLILTLTNSGGEDLQFTADVSPIGGSGPPQQILAFEDDVERGDNGWTSELYDGNDLWHRSQQTANSVEHSWACNVEGQGTYASLDVVSTAAISPPIDLRGVEPPISLWFFERFETEPLWDQCMVDVSADGGDTWTPLRGIYGEAARGKQQRLGAQTAAVVELRRSDRACAVLLRDARCHQQRLSRMVRRRHRRDCGRHTLDSHSRPWPACWLRSRPRTSRSG